MGLTVCIILFLLFIIYLLWVPMVLCINTTTNEYFIQLLGLAKVSLIGDKKSVLKLKLNVLFHNFYFYPLQLKSKKKENEFELKKGLKLLRAFKVKKLIIDIDTGDCILNAKLYPVFAFLNYNFGNFYINFEDRNQMVLYMESRPFNIIKSFINV